MMDEEQQRLEYGNCSCGAPGTLEHECPYAEEFCSPDKQGTSSCNCCYDCCRQCVEDI